MPSLVWLFVLEEVRLRRAFSSALSLFIFPQVLFIGSLCFSIFQPLLDDGASPDALGTGMVVTFFFFGVSMGGIAFLGKEFIEQSLGPVTMLATITGHHPVSERRMYLSYFLHDVVFFLMLVLLPTALGQAIGTVVRPEPFMEIALTISSQWASFLLGLSMSMAAAAIFSNRDRHALLAIIVLALQPLLSMALYGGPLGLLPPAAGLRSGGWWWMLLSAAFIGLDVSLGVYLYGGTRTDRTRRERWSYGGASRVSALLFPGDPVMRPLMTRDLLSFVRGRAFLRMFFSMALPLMVLLLISEVLGSLEGMDLRFNVPFFAVMLSFFSISIYSNLTNMDHLDFDQGMPVDAPMLIRVKVRTFLAISLPSSVIFLFAASILSSDYEGLFLALPLVIVTIPYMGYVTAYLTGLWTNSLLFDSGVFLRYILFTVLPLVFSTLLVMFYEEAAFVAVIGASLIVVMGVVAIRTISKKIDGRWGDVPLTSKGLPGRE